MTEDIVSVDELTGKYSSEVHEILNQKEHPSVFEDYEAFQLLNVRHITVTASALGFSSEAFLIKDGFVYIYNLSPAGFKKLPGSYSQMLEFLELLYSSNQRIINGYSDQIEKLEESLFERSIPVYFMDMWFDLKKDLAKIENFYYRNSVVYKEFYKKCENKFLELSDDFKDIDDMINFQNSNLYTLKTRMDSLHHYFDSIKSARMNKNLLALTLISGIFLPLNLIVGFFGMNTQGLYFENNPYGTQYVLFILSGIVAVALLGAPAVKILDKYLFKFILGRYDFYKTLSKRIGKSDARLKTR